MWLIESPKKVLGSTFCFKRIVCKNSSVNKNCLKRTSSHCWQEHPSFYAKYKSQRKGTRKCFLLLEGCTKYVLALDIEKLLYFCLQIWSSLPPPVYIKDENGGGIFLCFWKPIQENPADLRRCRRVLKLQLKFLISLSRNCRNWWKMWRMC